MTRHFIDKATEFSRDFEVEPKWDVRDTLLNKTIEFLNEEVRETDEAIAAKDLPEIIDGFGDVAFIALNGIYKTFRIHGRNHADAVAAVSEVMHRICNANLGKKHPDGTIQYNNGKVIKPAGWKAPEYNDMVAEFAG
jgi:hypothetical protein